MNLNYFRECVTNSEFLCAKPFNQRIPPDCQIILTYLRCYYDFTIAFIF